MVKRIKIYHKNKFLAKATIHSTLPSKFKGLMFSKKLKSKEAIILSSKKEDLYSIHMFFVFQLIDAIWLNKNKEIISIKRNIKPFTPLIKPSKKAQYIIELPKNSTRNIKIKDKIKFSKQ